MMIGYTVVAAVVAAIFLGVLEHCPPEASVAELGHEMDRLNRVCKLWGEAEKLELQRVRLRRPDGPGFHSDLSTAAWLEVREAVGHLPMSDPRMEPNLIKYIAELKGAQK